MRCHGAEQVGEAEPPLFAHYFLEMAELEDLSDFVDVELEEDEDFAGDDAQWGDHSLLIEDWFAAGDDLDAEGWEAPIANGWTDGVVLTRSAAVRWPVAAGMRSLAAS
jgi:hypothetical protein